MAALWMLDVSAPGRLRNVTRRWWLEEEYRTLRISALPRYSGTAVTGDFLLRRGAAKWLRAS